MEALLLLIGLPGEWIDSLDGKGSHGSAREWGFIDYRPVNQKGPCTLPCKHYKLGAQPRNSGRASGYVTNCFTHLMTLCIVNIRTRDRKEEQRRVDPPSA
jgi:hypothetical protein